MNIQGKKLNPFAFSYTPQRGNRSPVQQNPAMSLPHPLTYITGLRAELFQDLFKRKIVDHLGCVLQNVELPSLSEEEIRFIQEEIFKKFKVVLTETESIDISVGALMMLFSEDPEVQKRFAVHNTEINGGFVFYLLFKKKFAGKSYIERVFEALSIGDLYPKYASLFKTTEKKPSDLDCRMSIFKKGIYSKIEKNDLIFFKETIVDQIAFQHFKDNNELEKRRQFIINKNFSNLIAVDSYPNVFQLLAFQNSNIDWVIYRHFKRRCVFNLDALHLPIKQLLLDQKCHSNISLIPQAYQGKGAQIFIDCLLGIVRSSKTDEIDYKGWPRFISWMTKGCFSLPLDQYNLFQEQKLFTTFTNTTGDIGAYRLHLEINNWLDKHNTEKDPLFHLLFVLNAATCLMDKIPPPQIKSLLELQLKNLKLDKSNRGKQLAALLTSCLYEHKVPLRIIADFIQVAVLLHRDNLEMNDHLGFSIGTNDGLHPTLHIQIGDHVWQIPCTLNDSLMRLSDFQQKEPMLWEKTVKEFFSLYFLICPDPSSSIQNMLLNNLKIDKKALFEGYANMTGESPLLNLMTIDFLSRLPEQNVLLKGWVFKFTCYHAFNILSTIRNDFPRHEKRVRELLERVIGKQTLPKELSGDSNALWLKNLFVLDPAVGYDVWQKMVAQENKVHFSFPLIVSLTKHKPLYAHSMLCYLIKNNLLKTDNKTLDLLLSCAQIHETESLNFENEPLFETVANQISMICEKNFEEHVITAKNFLTEKKLLNLLLFLEKMKKGASVVNLARWIYNNKNFHNQKLNQIAKKILQCHSTDRKELSELLDKCDKNDRGHSALLLHYHQILSNEEEIYPNEAAILAKFLIFHAKQSLELPPNVWENFFYLIQLKASEEIITLFTTLHTQGVISNKRQGKQFQTLINIFITNCMQKKQYIHLLNLLANSKLLTTTYHNIETLDIMVNSLYPLLLAAAASTEPLTRNQIQNVRWCYQTAIQFLKQCEDKEFPINEQDITFNKTIHSFQLIYIRILFQSREQNDVSQGLDFFRKTYMTDSLSSIYPCPPVYFPLINALCTPNTLKELKAALILLPLSFPPNVQMAINLYASLITQPPELPFCRLLLNCLINSPEQQKSWKEVQPWIRLALQHHETIDHQVISKALFLTIKLVKQELETGNTTQTLNEFIEFTTLYLSIAQDNSTLLKLICFPTSADIKFFNELTGALFLNQLTKNQDRIQLIQLMLEAIMPSREKQINLNIWKKAHEYITLLSQSSDIDPKEIEELRKLHKEAFTRLSENLTLKEKK